MKDQQNDIWESLTCTNSDSHLLNTRDGDYIKWSFKIYKEFVNGFKQLEDIENCTTVFGSARTKEGSGYYVLAQKLGEALAKNGFTVMTGGGPGIMEAANRGAKIANGYSVGCNIKLPKEQKPNPYLDKWVEFDHFFVRKVMLLKFSLAFVALPGGLGTLDEVFETATLMQTDKIKKFPIILIGVSYWKPLINYLEKTLLASNALTLRDIKRLYLTDDIDEVILCIKSCINNKSHNNQLAVPNHCKFCSENND